MHSDKSAESYFGVPILVPGDKHAPGRAHNSIRATQWGPTANYDDLEERSHVMITAQTSLHASKRPTIRTCRFQSAAKAGAKLALLPSCICNINGRKN